jgi:hypothetical protein
MGIGISYTGHDGRTRKFDSGEEARSFLDSLGTSASRHTGDALRDAMARLPKPTQRQGGGTKVMLGGSVVDSVGGLCLRGEESTPLVEGVKMFASVNGSKGFKSFAEIDPPGSASVNGPMFGCDSEEEDESETGGGEAVRIPFVSRTKLVKDKTSGMVTIYEFIREAIFSPSGRLVGCSKERRRVVGSFMPGGASGESSSAKYCVKPVFSGGGLSALLFGTEKELDGGGASSSVTTTTCPNAGGGNG